MSKKKFKTFVAHNYQRKKRYSILLELNVKLKKFENWLKTFHTKALVKLQKKQLHCIRS